MNVFNPKILDACMRDVTSTLSDEQKADTLLYAMERLQVGRSRTLIENSVQSCLLIAKLSSENIVKARLMRAKARLAAGLHIGAQQDLQAILVLQPEHPEANTLMLQRVASSGKSPIEKHTVPRFSVEIWREIALWLPRRDLKTLLLIPHVLSQIAGQLLFRKVDLHFASDKLDSQRSADILTRIIVDPDFAGHVRTLRIFVPGRDTFPMAFHTGMLANALPKLSNLRNVHCAMRWKDILAFLRILESASHRIRGLSLSPSDGSGDIRFPRFKHITQLSYTASGGNPTQVNDFLADNRGSIRSIHLHNWNWTFPSEAISVRNLTHLDFLGLFPQDSRAIIDILANGHQLESLRMQCVLECHASAQFRQLPTALPFLRHFSFKLLGYHLNDHDLFPSITEFIRDRKDLRTLQLIVPNADWAQRRLGFDATVWGVLPSLTSLRSLSASLPKDVAAAVAMWLVPRTVHALSLHAMTQTDALSFVTQLRPGLPPGLLFIGLTHFTVENPAAVIARGFPAVKLARIDEQYYTVKPSATNEGQLDAEEWPANRVRYQMAEWLEWFGCEDAEWRDPTEFL